MNKADAEVIVIGAGPTGLTLAADLLRREVSVRIIDQALGPSEKSKALGVQAGTLEALESTLGAATSQRMLNLGRPAHEATIHIDSSHQINVDLSVIQSKYNFILILDQSLTEKVLTEDLVKYGGKVEWNTALTGLQQKHENVICEVSQPTGEKKSITAQYVVGCDGAHSKVRKILDLPFKGGQYEGEFILGDVQIEWPFSYSSIHVFISEVGVMPCFSLDGKGLYRLILIPKNEAPSARVDITFEEFSKIANSLAHIDLKIVNAQWLTRFRVHRLSQKFSVGRIFLAGDAAHIHSPAGGQGMNTGMQDALNLSHKFYSILRNGKSAELLNDYEEQRMPVAKNVLRATDAAFRAALFYEGVISKTVRRYILPRLVQTKAIRNRVIQALSEVSIARQEIEVRRRDDVQTRK